ncbi:MAG TPA: HEAT repeat domain-containing protein, partial [Planctomycetota bacterium]|nr:HEAT repeat domain-containing protein [Planctomycetota bacterium]
MGANGDRKAVPKLIELLGDENPRVGMMAELALGMLGDPAAVPPLEALQEKTATGPVAAVPYARLLAKESIDKIRAAQPLDPEQVLPTYLLPDGAAVDGDLAEWAGVPAVSSFRPANMLVVPPPAFHDFAASARFGMKKGSDDVYLLVVVNDAQREVRKCAFYPEAWFNGDFLDLNLHFARDLDFKTEQGRAAAGAPEGRFNIAAAFAPLLPGVPAEWLTTREFQDRGWKFDYKSVPLPRGVAYEIRIDMAHALKDTGRRELPPFIGIDLGLMDEDYGVTLGLTTSKWTNSHGYYRLFGKNRFFPVYGKLSTRPVAASERLSPKPAAPALAPPPADGQPPLPKPLQATYGEFPDANDVAAAIGKLPGKDLADLVSWAGGQGAALDAGIVRRLMVQRESIVRENTLAVLLDTPQDHPAIGEALRIVYENHWNESPFVLVRANILNERHAVGFRMQLRELLGHPDLTVAFTAGQALAKVGTLDDVPYFRKMLDDTLAGLRARYAKDKDPEFA